MVLLLVPLPKVQIIWQLSNEWDGKTMVHDCASLEKIRFIIRSPLPPSRSPSPDPRSPSPPTKSFPPPKPPPSGKRLPPAPNKFGLEYFWFGVLLDEDDPRG